MRWQAELDLRSLKQTMQMGILRAKEPAMVRKELWAHLLAYNLIRAVMAQVAHGHALEPCRISFKGALQTLLAFAPYVRVARPEELPGLAQRIGAAITHHRVGGSSGPVRTARPQAPLRQLQALATPTGGSESPVA